MQALQLKQDGTIAAAETQRHKRMTLVDAVRYAIEQGYSAPTRWPPSTGGSPRPSSRSTHG